MEVLTSSKKNESGYSLSSEAVSHASRHREKRKYTTQVESLGKRRRFYWIDSIHEQFTSNVFDVGLMNATPQRVEAILEKFTKTTMSTDMIIQILKRYAEFRMDYRSKLIQKFCSQGTNSSSDTMQRWQATQEEIISKITTLMESDFIEEETMQYSKSDLQFLASKRYGGKATDALDEISNGESSNSASTTLHGKSNRTISSTDIKLSNESSSNITEQPSKTPLADPEPRKVHFYRPVNDALSYQGRTIHFGLKIPYVDTNGRAGIKEISIRNFYHASLASLVIAASSAETSTA